MLDDGVVISFFFVFNSNLSFCNSDNTLQLINAIQTHIPGFK